MMRRWLESRAEKKRLREAEEQETLARLEQAEQDLLALKARGAAAVGFLTERRSRNHWRESIEHMIQGVS